MFNLSIPTGHEGDKVNLLPAMNGKRQNKEKEDENWPPPRKSRTRRQVSWVNP